MMSRSKKSLQANPDLLNILNSLRARCSLIHIPTVEERRVVAWLSAVRSAVEGGGAPQRSFYVWSRTAGLVDRGGGSASGRVVENTLEPIAALDRVHADVEKLRSERRHDRVGAIYVFCDLHAYLDTKMVVRRLRDIADLLRGTMSSVILVSPGLIRHPDLDADMTVIDFPLPTAEEIAQGVFDEIVADLRESGDWAQVRTREADLRSRASRAACGMAMHEADDVIAKAVAACNGLDESIIGAINEEKRRIVRRHRGLTFVSGGDVNLSSLGGMDEFKRFCDERALALSDEARDFGVESPRGVLMFGPPGTGKSLGAKVLSGSWKLPHIRLDLGEMREGVVGRSEGNLRAALRAVQAMAPCVLEVDEAEKAFAGASAEFVGDSGVAKDMLGYFLTWMQEQEGVFVYFSANSANLHPALLRRGRIDEIFFVGFPGPAERGEILSIHLAARGRDPRRFDLDEVVARTNWFVGSELEQVVCDGILKAFVERKRMGGDDGLEVKHLLEAAMAIKPLAQTKPREVQDLMRFARENNVRNASSRSSEFEAESAIEELIRSAEAAG
jgi:ATP-dependent 26S proteasome regulatory subunit